MALSSNTNHIPSTYALRAGDERMRRLGAYEPNAEVEAVIRKLIQDPENNITASQAIGGGKVNVPDEAYLRQIAGTVAQDTTDATSLMQLLPDLELVKNLLVSSIMAPKDLVSSELNFSVDQRAFHLPIAGQLLDVIVDHFTNIYNIKALCPEILEDVLFLTGSYPLLVVPENAVDELINGQTSFSNESFISNTRSMFNKNGTYRSLGILGPGPSESKKEEKTAANTRFVSAMESLREPIVTHSAENCYANSLGEALAQTVIITDNYDLAKYSVLQEAKRQISIEQRVNPITSMEAADGNYALGGVQRSRKNLSQLSMVRTIKTDEMLASPMVGHPLVMKIPSESVIPVFITPKKHLGAFLLLDQEGNFIRLANRQDVYNDLSNHNSGVGSGEAATSQMIQMTKNLSIGVNPVEAKDSDKMVKIYGQLLEHELKTRLAAGVYGKGANFHVSDEIYRVMMARSLKRTQTQILYVPSELLTYIAFDHAEDGTGRSLTEKSKILGSMRAMLGFANVMAGIKNSVSRQRVNLTLSDNDIDPSKTIARVMDEFTRRRNVTMPFVASDPADMISYINMAGVEWNVEGKGAPAHKVEVEDKVSNRAKVDTELENALRDRHYMGYGVTPETVLASVGADFATTVVTNNQMFAKRVITLQDKFTPFLEKAVRTISSNSGILMNKLYDVVQGSATDLREEGDREDSKEEVVDQKGSKKPTHSASTNKETKTPLTDDQRSALVRTIVVDFLKAIRISLPRPDTQTLESQSQAFDHMSDAIEKALTFIIDPAFLTEANLGEFAGHLDVIKAAVKAHYMRQWMRSNGFLPELNEITSMDEDGKAEFDLLKSVTDHAKSVINAMGPYLKKTGAMREDIKKAMDELNKDYPDADMGGSGGDGNFGEEETGGEEEGGELAPGLDETEGEGEEEETTAEEGTEEETQAEGEEETKETEEENKEEDKEKEDEDKEE